MSQKYIVYKYTNKINGKVYIGQTKGSLKTRAGNNGYKYQKCPYFYRAIQKYGWDNFNSEILDKNLTIEEANEKEKYYIHLYDSTNSNNGYNISIGGGSASFFGKEVHMYSLDGKYIMSFASVTEATQYVNGKSITNITRCCEGNANIAYGYVWSYIKEDFVIPSKIPENIYNANRKIYKFDLCGNLLDEYLNSIEAKLHNNIPKKSTKITECCAGKRKTAYGFVWSYYPFVDCGDIDISDYEEKKIYSYDLDGHFLGVFETAKDASIWFYKTADKALKIYDCCCKNKQEGISICDTYVFSYRPIDKNKFLDSNLHKKVKFRNIYQYDLDGHFIKEYVDINDVLNNMPCGTKAQNIYLCLQNKHNVAYGYMWSYDFVDKLTPSKFRHNNMEIYQYEKDGKLIHVFNTMKEARELYGNNITECCKGNRNYVKGYIWSYKKYDTLQELLNRKNDL